MRAFDLRADRADTIVPGALVLARVAAAAGARSILVPAAGVRDGILAELDSAAATTPPELVRATHFPRSAVTSLLRRRMALALAARRARNLGSIPCFPERPCRSSCVVVCCSCSSLHGWRRAEAGPPRRPWRRHLVVGGDGGAGPRNRSHAPSSEPAREDDAAVPVGTDDPVRGSRLALVTIVVFSDFQCPFCGKLATTFERVAEAYGDDVRFVFKHEPLSFHPHARLAAEVGQAVMALKGSEAFWRYHDMAFRRQQLLSPDAIRAWAIAAGADARRSRTASRSKRWAQKVERDEALAKRLGVSGTPASFVNGVSSPARSRSTSGRRSSTPSSRRRRTSRSAASRAIASTARMAAANFHEPRSPSTTDDDDDDKDPTRRSGGSPSAPPGARLGDGARHDRRVRRFPVPVLQEGPADARAPAHRVRRPRPLRVEGRAAPVPPARRSRPRSSRARRGRRRATPRSGPPTTGCSTRSRSSRTPTLERRRARAPASTSRR